MSNPQLNKLFHSIIKGEKPLGARQGAKFLEAICDQVDPAASMSKLMGNQPGPASLQSAMRSDLSIDFLNGPAASFLAYISAPDLKTIAGGNFLNQVLVKVVDPPFFWNAFTQAFLEKKLLPSGQHSFSWLLHQLMLLPNDLSTPYRDVARGPGLLKMLLNMPNPDSRAIAQKIKNIVETCNLGNQVSDDYAPGGRHDNDHVDFRKITILPTADELASAELPFLRPSSWLDDPNTTDTRKAAYLDNNFRLLREDMLYELREDLQIATGKKKGYSHGLVIDRLVLMDLFYGSDVKRSKWGITLQCEKDFRELKDVEAKDRKQFFTDHPKLMKHQSLACLLVNNEIATFATIHRDETLLARSPPVIVLQLQGEASVVKALVMIKAAGPVKLVQIDTALFSYEPILKALQKATVVPVSSELLFLNKDVVPAPSSSQSDRIIEALQKNPHQDLKSLLGTPKSIKLDASQAASLLAGLRQNVSLIQGPPGTGKSFIGALLAKALHDSTDSRILVVCYTNHALDQFLEDLLDIGIPESSMVRLGGKSTTRTASLSLHKQTTNFKFGRADWVAIDSLKADSESLLSRLKTAFNNYGTSNVRDFDILQYLEVDDPDYYDAFLVPQDADGMTRVGRGGRNVQPNYLLERWAKGMDAGIFKGYSNIKQASEIWGMTLPLRETRMKEWKQKIMTEQAEFIQGTGQAYDVRLDGVTRAFVEQDVAIFRSKRIIGCTTTAAAKYIESVQAASPSILLVEEAGEILESHILAAMGSTTEQLILIGDHKQLRPKVNHYHLTVEKGEGYDLNRSLFERLVLKGYPHETLSEQHRMRPEISDLIRNLTYPNLVDAASTKSRPQLKGVQDFVVFIRHDQPEDDLPQLADRRDITATSSKQNKYEVQMVLKIVRYLAQQGYGTEKIVILTPYLGQLQKLNAALKTENDPILNDLDSYDLVRAGLLPAATAKTNKRPIRLATIDNYQGEESDIVVASLTRSNAAHDIGFMSAPERLNVLLSRARDALILIGNVETFTGSRKGGDLWTRFINHLKRDGHIYDGLPAKCERHADRTAILRQPSDFDEECPDGGCQEPCGTRLNCGLHDCPLKCHQLYDHSKMPCEHIMQSKCDNGHNLPWKCHSGAPLVCKKCEREAQLTEQKRKEEFARQEKRDAEELAHRKQMAELDAQIAQQSQSLQDARLFEEREHALAQKKHDLLDLTTRSRNIPTPQGSPEAMQPPLEDQKPEVRIPKSKQDTPTTPSRQPRTTSSSAPKPATKSASKEDWERQKSIDGESNAAIDAIMDMTGLEEVKAQVLRIKAKIDTARRQNVSLKEERLNIVLLGNPGTGKTTVARHYAKFLTSLRVLPGNEFIETTGSRLANDGVPGIKKQIDDVVKAGGGAIFVDEAYQLASEHNFQGSQVLDFLLAEMENQVGTIVFILAGYNKQMEKFFEHNPGLRSRVPYDLQFADYTDDELLTMLEQRIEKTFKGSMKVEDGVRGLYGRIAVRRLGRGRDQAGFGNARALQNMLAKITERQAARINKERRQGLRPDDFLLVREDLIGPDLSDPDVQSPAWEKLQSLIGLGSVKESIRNLFDLISTNYLRELQEKEPIQMSLNRVFLGSPGTGKTTVAKLYGQILTDLGLLSNGEVIMKNPADFVGAVLGESEKNTKAILESTVGKVLIIDEAYMLYGGASNKDDPYKKAVIDTIVAEVQSVPGEDRCVLLLGYKAQILEMFQNVNPGLSRRFAIDDAFHFEDFSDSELLEVLNLKLKQQNLAASDAAKVVAVEVLSRARNRPNFGNGGEVENLLSQAKARYQSRQAAVPVRERSFDVLFEPQDFDPKFDRNLDASSNLDDLFADVVGCEEIVEKLRGYQQVATVMKSMGMDMRDQIPTNFIFKGPPGTGKTTTARKMGQVYYDMGFLSSTEVIEKSATDLIGEYVGQTGPKAKGVLDQALGRVLFIDEAYRLGEGPFAKEAIDELVGLLTQERYIHKIVVILAGYDQDMNRLLSTNSGLSSRFPEEVIFQNMSPSHCLQVLSSELRKKKIHLEEMDESSSPVYMEMEDLVKDMSRLPSWGNARDIKDLANQITSLAYKKAASGGGSKAKLVVAGDEAIGCARSMLLKQRDRNANIPKDPLSHVFDLQQTLGPRLPPNHSTRATSTVKSADPVIETQPPQQVHSDGRDAGVTDEIWNQLQADKLAAEMAFERAKAEQQQLEETLREAAEQEAVAQALVKKLAEARAKDVAERNELKRKHEEARLKELAAKAERDRITAVLEAKRKEEERQRRMEAEAQTKLRQMGVCVAGFRWIRQSGGYRCAGGSHFVSNAELGL